MASLNMAPEELKQLELLRNRFAQLASSLASLRANILNSNPLPSSESLQASAAILQRNIRSMQELATENADLFQRIAVHPSTNFPGRTQEHILLSLLRKKLEPDIESLVEEARETAQAAGLDVSKLAVGVPMRGEDDYGQDEDIPSDPFSEQWADMQDAFQETLQQYVTVQSKKKYTVEEQAMGIENVRTGLKQSLEESDEEDEDEDEEEDEEVQVVDAPGGHGVPAVGAGGPDAASGKPKLEPEHLFWLAARGDLNLPPNVPLESRHQEAAIRNGQLPQGDRGRPNATIYHR
ncbi:mediator of RNA polymerase II transcription complex subunit 8-domain-containing protein [Achaetomium macrosporum]|uniref:Mediator of RNA polymerase II transcription subunit 8 n=1 Tax=Achaetomium macrosporum TaxID=79813 RepID=A0AAN7CB70_9PEZI|nr:mediator of RNA polymerase II transcription complex subunit 8-domain-containing protein [Achaetomium macrosporum]